MKHSSLRHWTRAVLAGTGVALIALATPALAATPATGTSADAAIAQHHGFRHQRSPFLRAVHQLNLAADQQASVHSLLAASRQQWSAQRTGRTADFQALLNPGDPGHAAAVQAAQTRAASRIQSQSELEGRIYDLLTPAQKTALPGVLASLQSQMQQHRGEHWNKRAPVTSG